tara:strand:+ start:476 stop:712 length:237 start_codon:yes stop_codon:yes gene_type:complete
MGLTLDEKLTPAGLIADLAGKMKDDAAFADFMEDGEKGQDFIHFSEDVEALEYEPTEYADDLLTELYDYADEERIWLG